MPVLPEGPARRLLRSRGQSPDAVAVYGCVATSTADITAAEVAERVGMDPDLVGSLLEDLRQADLCRAGDAPASYRRVHPHNLLTAWQDGADEGAARAIEQALSTRRDVAALREHYPTVAEDPGTPLAVVELTGPSEAVGMLEKLTVSCQEVCTMLPFAPSATQLRDSLGHDRLLLDRGVRARLIAPTAIRKDRDALAILVSLADHGAEVRLHPYPRTRLTLVDAAAAILSRTGEADDPGTVVVQVLGITRALQQMFEVLWHDADPVLPGAGLELTAVDREILRLLFDGHKDATIARNLQLSVRTVRRLVADLSDRCGVQGRFALGARAAQLGWFELDPEEPAAE